LVIAIGELLKRGGLDAKLQVLSRSDVERTCFLKIGSRFSEFSLKDVLHRPELAT
jgi:hypothetical protein